MPAEDVKKAPRVPCWNCHAPWRRKNNHTSRHIAGWSPIQVLALPDRAYFGDYGVADDEFRKNIKTVCLISHTDMHTDGKRRGKQNSVMISGASTREPMADLLEMIYSLAHDTHAYSQTNKHNGHMISLCGGFEVRFERRSSGLTVVGGTCVVLASEGGGVGSWELAIVSTGAVYRTSSVVSAGAVCRTSSTWRLQTRPSSSCTWQECGELRCKIVPGCHFWPDRWSRARMVSPSAISLDLARLSWRSFILACSPAMWLARSGLTQERRVRSSRCRNSLAGDELVVACSVLL